MSQENLKVVVRMIAALNERDIDGYLGCCTRDIQLHTPLAAIGAEYEGPDAIRRFFADVHDTSPDFRVEVERLEPIGADRVMAFLQVTASGRTSGISTDTSTANVYDFVDGKVERVRIYFDRDEALTAARLQE